jgi:putative ABC transport system permease protein
MNLVSLAARNVLRNRVRTLLTVLGAAVAVLLFIMLRTIIAAWTRSAAAATDRLATRNKVSFIIPLPKNYIDKVRAVPGIVDATYMNWFGGKDPRNPDDFFANLAVETKTFLTVYDEVYLPPDQKQAWLEDRKGAIVGDALAKRLKLKVGDHFALTGTIFPGDWQFNIDGIYTVTKKSVDRSQFLFHWDYLNESIPQQRRDKIGWITSRIDDTKHSAEISAGVDRIFDEEDNQTATMSEKALNNSFNAMLSAVFTALDIVSVIILAIMMLILGNTIAMGVRERTREYGVLRAVGFTPRHIAIFILGEAVTTGIVAGALGLALAIPVVEMGMGRWLEENMSGFFPSFDIPVATMVVAFVLSVALAVMAAALPAYRASKLSVTDALRRVA